MLLQFYQFILSEHIGIDIMSLSVLVILVDCTDQHIFLADSRSFIPYVLKGFKSPSNVELALIMRSISAAVASKLLAFVYWWIRRGTRMTQWLDLNA